MLNLDTPAVVLRRSDYGESHRMVLLATRDVGTLSVVARHARKSVKRFGGGLEHFTLIRASLRRKKQDGPWNLERTRVMRFHEGFVQDMGRYAAGSYAVELFRTLVPQAVVEEDVFDWLAGFLSRWEQVLPTPVQMAAEELWLLSLLGHCPRFDRCVTCGREAPPRSWARFDAPAGGIVCSLCGGEGPRLGSRARRLLIAASGYDGTPWLDDEELARFALKEASTIRRCMDGTIRALMDREPRSMPGLREAWRLR